MKVKAITTIMIMLFLASMMMFCNKVKADTDTTLHDGFKGITLDTSKWTILDGAVGISTNYGTPPALRLFGDGLHKRIDSLATFGKDVFALARIKLSGDYQKFGLRVNPTEFPAGTVGMYFDTKEPAYGGETNKIWTRVIISGDGYGPILLDQKVDATWNAWHIFKIKWMDSSISFFVDGVEVSSVLTTGYESYFGSASLPVGIWNDRLSEMLVDWVFVTPKNVWLDQYDAANILADLTDTTPGTVPNFFDYRNSLERIAQFSEEKGVLFSSSIYTTSIANQYIGILIVNEGADLTFGPQPDPGFISCVIYGALKAS